MVEVAIVVDVAVVEVVIVSVLVVLVTPTKKSCLTDFGKMFRVFQNHFDLIKCVYLLVYIERHPHRSPLGFCVTGW